MITSCCCAADSAAQLLLAVAARSPWRRIATARVRHPALTVVHQAATHAHGARAALSGRLSIGDRLERVAVDRLDEAIAHEAQAEPEGADLPAGRTRSWNEPSPSARSTTGS